MTLPYAGSVECSWDDGWGDKKDVWPCGLPAKYVDKMGNFCCEQHWPLVIVAGLEPKPLPVEPEILTAMKS